MESENRIALIGIVVEDPHAAEPMNTVLHAYAAHIIGRMGIPHREREISIISIVLDAPGTVISALAGKLGRITGLNVKTLYSKTGGTA